MNKLMSILTSFLAIFFTVGLMAVSPPALSAECPGELDLSEEQHEEFYAG